MCINDEKCSQFLKDKYLTNIFCSLMQFKSFISDILAYFQIQQNEFKLDITQLNLGEILDDLKKQFEPVLKEKNIDLILDYPEEISYFALDYYTDTNVIKQILSNFLHNALKNSNNGQSPIKLSIQEKTQKVETREKALTLNKRPNKQSGSVSFRNTYQYSKDDSIQSEDLGISRSIEISLTDSGTGMTLQQQENLKQLLSNYTEQKNFQVSNSSGLWLGMRICQLLSYQIGSSGISFKSIPNKGSQFSFEISKKFSSDECISPQKIRSNLNSTNSPCLISLEKVPYILKEKNNIMATSYKSNAIENFQQEEISESNDYQQIASKVALPSFQVRKWNELSNKQITTDSTNLEKRQDEQDFKELQKKKFSKFNILIVDDDCFNLLCLDLIFKEFGFNVLKSNNGQLALAQVQASTFQNQQISLIIMDYQMPIMDGIQATTKIKQYIKENNLEDIPIIGCSAFNGQKEVNEFLSAGASNFMSKPLNQLAIDKLIEKYF